MTKTSEAVDIFTRNVPSMTEKLRHRTVGIAGCGGLGSNAAVALARAGIGKLIIADMDVVEASNLNRQHYYLEDIGKKKIQALTSRLHQINPLLEIIPHDVVLSGKNIYQIFAPADLLIEAFDLAESKAMLIETWCTRFPERPIVCGSGVAGVGNTSKLKVNRAGNIIICGDFETDMKAGLSSARVAIVANMQANEAIELLLNQVD